MIHTVGSPNAAEIAKTATLFEKYRCEIVYLGPGSAMGGNAWQLFVRIPDAELEQVLAAVRAALNPPPAPFNVENN